MELFELVYPQVRGKSGSDEIKLSQYVVKDRGVADVDIVSHA